MYRVICCLFDFLKRRAFLILWISFVMYLFYNTFIFYNNERQFYYLRGILGLGLCISRGTATVLNLCCALVLLPFCKKLMQVVYRAVSGTCPGLLFFWLERAKSFHMTVASTLLVFAVMHSASHIVNLWNFSVEFNDHVKEINFASYKNENPLLLLMSFAGLSGVTMLAIILAMGMTSMTLVRRRYYNAFWFTHQLYLPFMVLLILHPMSGVLKEEILQDNYASPNPSQTRQNNFTKGDLAILHRPQFTPIKSTTWIWMVVPLTCFISDLLWRILSRNRTNVDIIKVQHMAGGTLSLKLSVPYLIQCRMGQYILLQCPDISLLEWHPFTIVKIPTTSEKELMIWVRVKGDWTEALELLLEDSLSKISLLIDGPFISPMQKISSSGIAMCVAAGVGITPFVSLLHHIYMNPRSRLPGRIHLIWIVRNEDEISWLAKLASKTIETLRIHNRLDRLHIEFYITGSKANGNVSQTIIVNEKGKVDRIVNEDEETKTLLTPKNKRNIKFKFKPSNEYINKSDDDNVECKKSNIEYYFRDEMTKLEKELGNKKEVGMHMSLTVNKKCASKTFDVVKEYPILGCRVKKGRPHWDRVFGYWIHLYPRSFLDVYCCGPKSLVKVLRNKCRLSSRTTKTKFTFIHEGF